MKGHEKTISTYIVFFIGCDSHSFKNWTGNEACLKCGNDSYSGGLNTQSYCRCFSGYLRPLGQEGNSTAPCFHKGKYHRIMIKITTQPARDVRTTLLRRSFTVLTS